MAESILDHAICDYEGTSYRARFWDGQGREYEDLAERIALSQLLPPSGRRIVEIGAGFGRLAELYAGYEQVVLVDYAVSGLREAQERLGDVGSLCLCGCRSVSICRWRPARAIQP